MISLETTSLIVGLFINLYGYTDSKICEDPKFRQEYNAMLNSPGYDTSRLPPEYECPRSHDPPSLTECCWDGGCCPKRAPAIYQVDDWIMMLVTICVIISCMLIILIVLVCCFCSKCPFYDTCRVNYTSGDVVIYELAKEDDHLVGMPLENGGNTHYTPYSIKIKPVEEV